MDIFSMKEHYTIEDLLVIMRLLRSENGCPWDREQTHESIRHNFLEETYEVLDAIDKKDASLLKEELGDVLLQVVFHARMEEEAGRFGFDDVCDGICKKLIVRHPHVFGSVDADTADQVLKNWDEIKKQTKGQKTATDTINDVPRAFPALMRSQKVQHRAARAGFDWDDIGGTIDKLREEVDELSYAIERDEPAERKQEELGDVLFAAVNVARFLKVDGEETLERACDKFAGRFSKLEQLCAARGIEMKTASVEQLDKLWEEVKTM